jgi:hypothetical protein
MLLIGILRTFNLCNLLFFMSIPIQQRFLTDQQLFIVHGYLYLIMYIIAFY